MTVRRPLAVVASTVGLLVSASACRNGNNDGGTAASTTGVLSRATTSSAPATRGPKTITFGSVTFQAPATWGIDMQGDTAFVGLLAGASQDVMLRVERNFAGTIDSLKPTTCPREGDPAEPATAVTTVESGFRPVGSKNAEYRRWRVTCPTVGSHDHRAWLLPISKVAIYEQVSDGHPENVDVVTTAEVG
jgi:hypothetical protein